MAKMTQPLFSVVIPVCNKEPHVARAIRSVLNQVVSNFELIIVCDPSTDNSYREVTKFCDSRIRLFTRDTPGPGGYAARNLGVEKASADWVAFLDADDEWTDDHLATVSDLIGRYPRAGLVGTSWVVLGNNLSPSANAFRLFQRGCSHRNITFSEYLHYSSTGRPPFWTSCVAIKRAALRNVGGFPAGRCRRGGDVDTWLRVMALVRDAAWSATITARYNRDSENMVTRTEEFTATTERETVKELLLEEQDPEIAKKLKRFANSRIISGYIQTTLLIGHASVRLKDLLFFDCLSRQQKLAFIVSLLPPSILRLSHKLISSWRAGNSRLRAARGNLRHHRYLNGLLGLAKFPRDFASYVVSAARSKAITAVDVVEIRLRGYRNTFCGYYDVSPFRPSDDSHIVLHANNAMPFLPHNSCTSTDIILLDLVNPNSWKKIASTHAWNWQQGARAGWIDRGHIVFNVFENGTYHGRIYSVDHGSSRDLGLPVMSWFKNDLFCSIDFRALCSRNSDYGYNSHSTGNGKVDICIAKQSNSQILWCMNVDHALNLVGVRPSKAIRSTAYFNHPMFSPDGERMIFLFRYIENGKKRHYTFCWTNTENSVALLTDEPVSHYAWIDGSRYIYWGSYFGINGYHEFNVTTKKTRTINDTLPDGHPTTCSDSRCVSDTYSVPFLGRTILELDCAAGSSSTICTVPEYPSWTYDSRCDPHPSISYDEQSVQIDSMMRPSRTALILKRQ